MNIDVGPNITSLLERLASQIGTTADKVFPWYVQQSYLDGMITLIVLAAGLSVSLVALIYGVIKGKWEYGDPSNLAAALTIMGGICFSISSIGALVAGPEAATQMLNPQYHAMKMLTRDVGKMVGK